jgi:two-component system, OmpR family, response regulator
VADRTPKRILVIEDDFAVASGLVKGLSKAGFLVTLAMDGDIGAQRGLCEPFSLAVLDLTLPGKDGLEVLESWSGRLSLPVIVLSARTELQARLHAFELGAVDFLPKPFWMEELVARIRTRLRLSESVPARTVRWFGVELDLDGRCVRRDGRELPFTSHEFNVLAWLAERPGRSISRRQLAENALSHSGEAADRTVDSHVSRVRRKLGMDAAQAIRTIWGVGYRFDLPPEDL